MTELESYLETIEPELRVMTRLFGFPESVWDDPKRFVPQAAEEDGTYRITFTAGDSTATRSSPIPDDPDGRVRILHRKRAARRLCKQTLYDLCKAMTGIHPPWGSMTGVRPTHLMLEALGAGLSPEEAVRKLAKEFDVMPERAHGFFILLERNVLNCRFSRDNDTGGMGRGMTGHTFQTSRRINEFLHLCIAVIQRFQLM